LKGVLLSTLRKALGKELKARRKAQGLSLRALSAKAKVSLGFLSEIERGQKEVSSELLNAILEALNTPLSEVVLKAGASIAAQERNAVVVKMPVKAQHRAA
jgi:transcriptional regulator with XRE-family HTH domain